MPGQYNFRLASVLTPLPNMDEKRDQRKAQAAR